MANSSSRSFLKLISDQDRQVYEIVNYVFISSGISLFGIVANVMNMVVFYKQGFASTTNISFFGLAISDLCGLITLLWCSVCFNPLFVTFDVPMVAQDVQYLIGGIPRIYFGRISAWITVYITAERCLSIMVPLKVKLIVTPRRTALILCLIYTIMTIIFLPEYGTAYIDWKFYPSRNKTLVGMVFTAGRKNVDGLMYILYSILGLASFAAVIILTAILVFQLKKKSQWRLTANADKVKTESVSSKERKTMTMVVMIATVLIVCNIPGAATTMAMFIEPEFGILGVNVNVLFCMWSFIFICDAINSSVNIFLYYSMSSKFRETFHQVFGALDAS